MAKLSSIPNGTVVNISVGGTPVPFKKIENNHYGKSEVTLSSQETFVSYGISYNSQTGLIGMSASAPYYKGPFDCWLTGVFRNMLDPVIRASLVDVPIKVTTTKEVSGITTINRSVFLPNLTECGVTGTVTTSVAPVMALTFVEMGKAFTTKPNSMLDTVSNRNKAVAPGAITAVSGSTTLLYFNGYFPKGSSSVSDVMPSVMSGYTLLDVYAPIYIYPMISLDKDVEVISSGGSYVVTSGKGVEAYRKIDGTWRKIIA